MKAKKRVQPPEVILTRDDFERKYFPDYFKEKKEKEDRLKKNHLGSAALLFSEQLLLD